MAARTGNPYSPHLDTLRILASIGIVILHYANYVEETPIGRFVADHTLHFNYLVDLFFVISGYVIANQYLHRVSGRHAISRFLWRRMARVYPLHIATLAFYLVIALLLALGYVQSDNPARYPLSDVPAQVLLLHAIDGQRLTFNFPSWSLSAELVCYLLFPLLAFTGLRRPKLVIVLAIGCAGALTIYSAVSGAPTWPEWINKGGAFRALPAFMLGMVLQLFSVRMGRIQIGAALLPAFAAFVFLGWALPPLADVALVYLIAAAAVQCDVSRARTLLSRLGVGRWAHLTYSSYMLHMPVATLVVTVGGHLLAAHAPPMRFVLVVLAMVVLVFVSVASYRLFEEPARRRLNAAFDRYLSRPAPSAALAAPHGRAR